jgi:hypothetical protein
VSGTATLRIFFCHEFDGGHTEHLGTILFFAGIAAEAAIVTVVVVKRLYRTLPVFCSYLVWSLVVDIGGYTLVHLFPAYALHVYFTQTLIDSIFQFGVLIELSLSVLRPVRSSLPRATLIVIAGLITVGFVCAVVWPFAKSPGFSSFPLAGRLLVHVQQTFSIMRILYFLGLAGCSQLLSIGWRDRELQIATGLGFFSLVSLSVSMIHAGQAPGPLYHMLDQMVAASYVCSILYWIFSFVQEAPERRPFTPQMQNFLLAMAGAARADRASLTGSSSDEKQRRRKP